MKIGQFFLLTLLVICFACSEKEEVKAVIEDCTTLADRVVVSEGDKSNTCFYLEVYRYQSAIYTVCECCVCDKAPIAINCEGQALCDFTENCMGDFYKEADYLFSVGGE